jgi:sugar phosphate permease
MFCSHAPRGLLVSGLCVLTVTGSALVWQFHAIAAAFGLADAFFWPASDASCRSWCSRATCLPLTPC